MNSRTRRFLMPAASLLLVAACATPAPSATPDLSNVVAITTPAPSTASPSAGPSAAPLPISTIPPTQALIDQLLAQVAADPTDAAGQRDLGLALLQRIRETADPTLYTPAEAAFRKAQALFPDDVVTLVGLGGLQLGRHQFALALTTGEAAVKEYPEYAPARGVVVDALVELGRYDEALTNVKKMVSLSSDITSLSRLSYLKELHGDLAGARVSMRAAAASPGLAPENTAYIEALLGNLEVENGDPAAAAAAYQRALVLVPSHAPSIAGLGRLAVGRGDLADAIAQFQRASDILPLPEYVIALGDAKTVAGDAAGAKVAYGLARVEITLFQANGVVVDQELALFEADHGDPAKALDFAETAYKATPTVRAADVVAWCLHRLGRDQDAMTYVTAALRLGSRDALIRYHAGAIEAALGQTADAKRDLGLALQIDPGFSAVGAQDAARILASLQ
jgi:tetratricopeptide (TPR) repeat protein